MCIDELEPCQPAKISPSVQGSVKTYIKLASSEFVYLDPSRDLLLRPRFELSASRFALRDLVRKIAECRILTDDDSQVLLRLSGDSEGLIKEFEHLEIQLSPRFGNLVSKFSRINRKKKSVSEFGVAMDRAEFEVTRFKDLGDGVIMPVAVDYRIHDSNGGEPLMMSRMIVSRIRMVNRAVGIADFEMRFPEHSLVVDQASSPGEVKWWLWGPGNKPLTQIQSKGELFQLDKNPAVPAKRPVVSRLAWFLSAVVVVIVVVFTARKLKRIG